MELFYSGYLKKIDHNHKRNDIKNIVKFIHETTDNIHHLFYYELAPIPSSEELNSTIQEAKSRFTSMFFEDKEFRGKREYSQFLKMLDDHLSDLDNLVNESVHRFKQLEDEIEERFQKKSRRNFEFILDRYDYYLKDVGDNWNRFFDHLKEQLWSVENLGGIQLGKLMDKLDEATQHFVNQWSSPHQSYVDWHQALGELFDTSLVSIPGAINEMNQQVKYGLKKLKRAFSKTHIGGDSKRLDLPRKV